MATMPNVVGIEYQDALTAMVSAGVRSLPLGYFQTDPVSLVWMKSASVKPGFVISQLPTAGASNIAANSAVTLVVANPPMSVAYPAGGTQV